MCFGVTGKRSLEVYEVQYKKGDDTGYFFLAYSLRDLGRICRGASGESPPIAEDKEEHRIRTSEQPQKDS